MKAKAGVVAGAIVLAMLGFMLAYRVASPAYAHTDPCHTQHTCPSDHHTYVWIDPRTGLGWDCVEPGAREYDPTRDTTTIVWLGLTYYCRAAGGTTTTTTTTVTTSTTLPTTATEPTTTILPIKSITPGALNVRVRQSTIRRTICVPGWTRTIRPSSSYTNALKLKQMPLYEETGPPSAYEEDHLIPLELGGAPRNPKNLWPEPRAQAKQSDPLETRLKRQVCQRTLTLAAARLAIRQFKFSHG
jgi:hypothetical protein